MDNYSRFTIVHEESNKEKLVIRDIGPHDTYKTVTNGAEEVVARLYNFNMLNPNRRLFYYDSEGELAEIRHTTLGFKDIVPAVKESAGT